LACKVQTKIILSNVFAASGNSFDLLIHRKRMKRGVVRTFSFVKETTLASSFLASSLDNLELNFFKRFMH
jgi:hypothetical protein